jgi:hypothetical protein
VRTLVIGFEVYISNSVEDERQRKSFLERFAVECGDGLADGFVVFQQRGGDVSRAIGGEHGVDDGFGSDNGRRSRGIEGSYKVGKGS